MKVNKYNLILVFFFVVLSVVRFVNIDQDGPSYMVSGVSIEDEAYYAVGAIERFNELDNTFLSEFYQKKSEVLVFGQNLITTPFIYFLGDNYWGLRGAPLVMSLLSILLLFNIYKRIILKNNLARDLLVLIFLFSDFYFGIFSRFYAPQGFSIFAISVLLYIVYRPDFYRNKISFLVGITCSLLVLFIYPYNAFVVLGILLMYGISGIKYRRFKPIYMLIAGGLIGIVIFIGILWLFSYSPMDYITNMTVFNKTLKENSVSEPLSILTAVVNSFKSGFYGIYLTNLLRYNLSYFLIIVVGLWLLIRKNFKSDLLLNWLPFLVLFSGFVQGLFINSFPFKKWVVLFPFLFMIIINILNFLEEHKFEIEVNRRLKIVFSLSVLCSIILAFNCLRVNRAELYWSTQTKLVGYFEIPPFFLDMFNIGACLGLSLVFILLVFNFIERRRVEIVLCLLCIPGVVFSYNYFYNNPTFLIRDNLVTLSSYVDDKVIIDGLALPYTLYNRGIPGYTPYDYSLTENEIFQRKMMGYIKYPNSLEILRTHQDDLKYNIKEGESFLYDSNQYKMILNLKCKYYRIQLIELQNTQDIKSRGILN